MLIYQNAEHHVVATIDEEREVVTLEDWDGAVLCESTFAELGVHSRSSPIAMCLRVSRRMRTLAEQWELHVKQ